MIKGIIFDLDMCILDTRSLKGPFFEPVIKPLRDSDLTRESKDTVITALWTTSLEDTIELFSIPTLVAERMREAYRNLDVPEGIYSFGDENVITEINTVNILVTTGYKKFQTTKIERLGIRSLFDEVIIDELDYKELRKGKKQIFSEILEKYGWSNHEVLVIGDNPASELGAGKELGIRVVQTLRDSVVKWDMADHHIKGFSELKELVYTEGNLS